METYIECNECKIDIVKRSFYSSYDCGYDICDTCLENKNFNVKWNNNKLYICCICSDDSSLWNLSLCEQCYNDEEKTYSFIKNKFNYFDYEKKDDYIFLDSPFTTSFYNSKIPLNLENLEDLITPIKDIIIYKEESIESLIPDLMAVNLKSSVFDWKNFTEFTSFNLIDFGTSFLININKDSCEFRNIAIVITDDHGRHRIINVFKNIYQFRDEYDKFKLNTKARVINESEILPFIEILYEKYEEYEEILSYIDDFGYYYTLRHNLPYNHG